MLPSGAVEGPSKINSFEHESGPSSPPKLGKEPVTPELEQQAANRSRFGVPTPDATPESVRVAPGDRRKQVFVHPVGPKDLGPVTPSISSRAPSTEEITENREQYSQPSNIDSDDSEGELSEEPGLSLTPPPLYLDQEDQGYSAFVVQSVYNSIISFLNLAKQRNSRADDARVQGAIDLIKAIQKGRRTRVGNLTRTLTAKQYGELRRAIEESEDDNLRGFFEDKLRYDYTRHKKRLEIRMPTSMHEEVGEWVKEQIIGWTRSLRKSPDARISAAAKSIVSSGQADINFPFARGEPDSRSPDLSVRHTLCERKCRFPSIVVEIAWSQNEEDVQHKVEDYSHVSCSQGVIYPYLLWDSKPDSHSCISRRSQGEIRTVLVIDMRKMYLAEKRNEKRLYQMYLDGEVDERGSYSYPHDDDNETGEASILVWKAKTQRNGRVKAVCVVNRKFRGETGRAIDSVPLRFPLQDFICRGILDSPAGEFEAPPLEISLEDLNDECIQERLAHYRIKRDRRQKEAAEEAMRQAREQAQKRSRKKKEAKTRGAASQEGGLLGRMRENGRLISTRIGQRKT